MKHTPLSRHPADRAPSPALGTAPPTALKSSIPPLACDSAQLLVVASTEARRESIAYMAECNGYDATFAEQADDVFARILEDEPDLLLMDVYLPEQDGVDLCKQLRRAQVANGLPIALLGDPEDSDDQVAAALLAGADDYILCLEREEEVNARIQVQLRHKRDRDALKRVRNERERFRRDAERDPLTGLRNRRATEQHIHRLIESCEPFSVLFVDIDNFKSINDELGHESGDAVLRSIALRMREGVRPGDVIGRHGGEEFLVVLAGANAESAQAVAERERRHIESMRVADPRISHVTVSIGAAAFDPTAGDEPMDVLLRRADFALYRAKQSGRNQVILAPAFNMTSAEELRRPVSGVHQAVKEVPPSPGTPKIGFTR